MDALPPWLTPALLLALFSWLRRDMGELRRDIREQGTRIGALAQEMSKRFDEVNRELAEMRERMAKLEGSLEGFLAGRRDRGVA